MLGYGLKERETGGDGCRWSGPGSGESVWPSASSEDFTYSGEAGATGYKVDQEIETAVDHQEQVGDLNHPREDLKLKKTNVISLLACLKATV